MKHLFWVVLAMLALSACERVDKANEPELLVKALSCSEEELDVLIEEVEGYRYIPFGEMTDQKREWRVIKYLKERCDADLPEPVLAAFDSAPPDKRQNLYAGKAMTAAMLPEICSGDQEAVMKLVHEAPVRKKGEVFYQECGVERFGIMSLQEWVVSQSDHRVVWFFLWLQEAGVDKARAVALTRALKGVREGGKYVDLLHGVELPYSDFLYFRDHEGAMGLTLTSKEVRLDGVPIKGLEEELDLTSLSKALKAHLATSTPDGIRLIMDKSVTVARVEVVFQAIGEIGHLAAVLMTRGDGSGGYFFTRVMLHDDLKPAMGGRAIDRAPLELILDKDGVRLCSEGALVKALKGFDLREIYNALLEQADEKQFALNLRVAPELPFQRLIQITDLARYQRAKVGSEEANPFENDEAFQSSEVLRTYREDPETGEIVFAPVELFPVLSMGAYANAPLLLEGGVESRELGAP